jgi:hypothetical protein
MCPEGFTGDETYLPPEEFDEIERDESSDEESDD